MMSIIKIKIDSRLPKIIGEDTGEDLTSDRGKHLHNAFYEVIADMLENSPTFKEMVTKRMNDVVNFGTTPAIFDNIHVEIQRSRIREISK